MVGPDQVKVSCPACGKEYRWKVEFAGRKVKCACGKVIRMPAEATGKAALVEAPAAPAPKAPPPPKNAGSTRDIHSGSDANPYDLDDSEFGTPAPPQSPAKSPDKPKAKAAPAVKPGGAGKCPNCGNKVAPTAVICLNCGFNLKSGERVKTDVDADDAPATRSAPAGPSVTSPFARIVQQGEAVAYPPAKASLTAAVTSFICPALGAVCAGAIVAMPKRAGYFIAVAAAALFVGGIWGYYAGKMARNAKEDIKNAAGRYTGETAVKQAELLGVISFLLSAFGFLGLIAWWWYVWSPKHQ